MKLTKSLVVLCGLCVGFLVVTGAAAAIQQDPNGSYGYYGGYSNNPGYTSNCAGYAGNNYGIAPYPQQPAQQYCRQWVPGRWVPVRVMVPGRWEHRPVWIPGYRITLYKPVPGYWYQSVRYGQPDLSVWQTPNGWYGSPSQGQTGGYFDQAGVWRAGW